MGAILVSFESQALFLLLVFITLLVDNILKINLLLLEFLSIVENVSLRRDLALVNLVIDEYLAVSLLGLMIVAYCVDILI